MQSRWPATERSLRIKSARFCACQCAVAARPRAGDVPREASNRIVGLSHFAVLSCAFLRYRGIPRGPLCFATYFQVGQGLDHWITEY